MEGNLFDLYQEKVTKVQKYSKNPDLYLISKLTEETGEVAKEFIRKEDGRGLQKNLEEELGDILWCITAIAERNGILLSDIVSTNLKKLKERNLL